MAFYCGKGRGYFWCNFESLWFVYLDSSVRESSRAIRSHINWWPWILVFSFPQHMLYYLQSLVGTDGLHLLGGSESEFLATVSHSWVWSTCLLPRSPWVMDGMILAVHSRTLYWNFHIGRFYEANYELNCTVHNKQRTSLGPLKWQDLHLLQVLVASFLPGSCMWTTWIFSVECLKS